MRKDPDTRVRLPIAVYPILLIPVVIIILLIILGWGKGWWSLPRDIPPPDTSDLVLDRLSIPDEENAFTYLDSEKLPLVGHEELSKGAITNAARRVELLGQNEALFAQLEKGLQCSCLEAPLVEVDESSAFMTKWMSVGRLLGLKAAHEREAGQHDEALKTCGTLLKFSSLTRQRPTSTIQLLMSDAVLRMWLAQVVVYTRDPAVTEEQLAGLAAALEDLPLGSDPVVYALKAEFNSAVRLVNRVAGGEASDMNPWVQYPRIGRKFRGPPEYSMQPNRTRKALAASTRVRIQNVGRCFADLDFTGDPYVERQQISPQKMLKPNGIGNLVGNVCLWQPHSLATHLLRIEADASAAKIIVACRRHQLAQGTLPDRLDDLVPDYLSAVPRDPFDGKPFRYKMEEDIIYAVGEDLADNDGSRTFREANVKRNRRWRAEDVVFGISQGIIWEQPTTNSPSLTTE